METLQKQYIINDELSVWIWGAVVEFLGDCSFYLPCVAFTSFSSWFYFVLSNAEEGIANTDEATLLF